MSLSVFWAKHKRGIKGAILGLLIGAGVVVMTAASLGILTPVWAGLVAGLVIGCGISGGFAGFGVGNRIDVRHQSLHTTPPDLSDLDYNTGDTSIKISHFRPATPKTNASERNVTEQPLKRGWTRDNLYHPNFWRPAPAAKFKPWSGDNFIEKKQSASMLCRMTMGSGDD